MVVAVNIINAGCCYTNLPRIAIASPPFVPSLSIAVSKIKISQKVVLGRNYVLESSQDLIAWTAVDAPFVGIQRYEAELIICDGLGSIGA